MVVRRARSVFLAVLTLAAGLTAASTAPPLGASWRQQRLVFGSDEYKAAVPQKALLCHVLLTHASYVVSIGFVQTTVYSCFPLMKEAGVLSQQQISRMLTAGTACFVVGKLTTAQILDLVGPKAAFITNMIIGGLLCLTFASGLSGLAAEICWCVYKLFSATSWPSVVQMLAYWASRRDVAKAFSLYSTASRTGAIAASLGVGVLMRRSEHGWKLALLGTGLATLLVFLLCKGVVDETPARVLAQHNVAATSPLEYRPLLLRALRLQWQRRPKLPERLQRLQRESHQVNLLLSSPGPSPCARRLFLALHASPPPHQIPATRARRCGEASPPDRMTWCTLNPLRCCVCSRGDPISGSPSALPWAIRPFANSRVHSLQTPVSSASHAAPGTFPRTRRSECSAP